MARPDFVILNEVKNLSRRSRSEAFLLSAQRTYHVYVMSNMSKTLYVGVTGDLHRRVWERRQKSIRGFTQQYNITMLVRIEEFSDIRDAIAREKQLKGWKRERKLALIPGGNPLWLDLAAGWYS